MIAAELTNQMIPPLKLSDSGAKALNWMEELRTSELPVVKEGKFLGLLSEDIILETETRDLPVGSYPLIAPTSKVAAGTHYYDIIKVAGDNHVKMVAVVDESDTYQGVITVQDTMTAFSQTMAVQSPGAILVLSMPTIDYSLATISRLIEENNAKILSACVTEDPLDSSLVKLTLKINQSDLTRIVATMERFEYRVIGRFQDTGADETQDERYGLLMKYLNI